MFDEIQVPTDFSVLTDDALSELDTTATEAAEPLLAKVRSSEALQPDELDAFERLASVVDGVRGERAKRVTDAADASKTGKRASDAAAKFATKAQPDGEGTEGDDGEPDDDAEGTEPPATKGKKSVTASGKPRRPGVADVAKHSDKDHQGPDGAEPEGARRFAKVIAAPNLPTVNAGSEFADVMAIAQAAEAQFATYSGLRGTRTMVKHPVAFMRREYPPELRLDENKAGRDDLMALLDYAGSEARLEGNSLVAAAGWCAPSEIDYQLFELETTAGLWDGPSIQVSRGGLQFTTGPDFSTIFGGSGYWHQTEAQVQASTSKPCMVISCPSFTEKRLEVEGVCVTGAFLQDRGYPEMVARFVRGTMTAHVHKLNIFVLNQLVAGSTLFDYTNVANLPITTTEYKDLTVLSRLLAIAGIQIMDYRYKYRMAPTDTLEMVMPWWVVESVRADVQRRTGMSTADAFSVALDQINSYFAVRGARCQYVYDWLDSYNTTNTSTVGQTAGVYTLPTTVEFLLYAAGTWVKGVSDVVRLDTVYDSTNLAINQYTQLFAEEGITVMKRGFESRRIKTTIDPSGATGATVDMRTG
jgi:hypothetical protein